MTKKHYIKLANELSWYKSGIFIVIMTIMTKMTKIIINTYRMTEIEHE